MARELNRQLCRLPDFNVCCHLSHHHGAAMDTTLRQSLYRLMLIVTVGLMVARVANVEFLYEPSLFKAYPHRKWPDKAPAPWPTFGSNDRARWATVKAIVEEETFVIGHRNYIDPADPKKYVDTGIRFTDGYGSVDIVLNPETNDFYATKPPLLTMAVAAEYKVLRSIFGWQLNEQKWEVVIAVLLTFNVLPLAIALLLFSRLVERFGTTDWGRLFVYATACFGTFLTTFAITLNNHVPAACCVFFATYALLTPSRDGTDATSSLRFAIVGLFAGMAICLDLPSAAFAGLSGFLIVLRSRTGALIFTVALLVPIALQTAINLKVFGTWVPIYAKFGGPWYEFAGSHWEKLNQVPRPAGIDFIDEPKHVYAFHFLFGHHGLFSLSPVWLLVLAGWTMKFGVDQTSRLFHRLMPLLALVVIGFYVYKTNNYGGWTSGPRWLFWTTPLLLLGMIPFADRIAGSRTGRGIAFLFLSIAAFSATYTWGNPWRHPWIYQWCEYMGWVKY